MAHRRKKRQTHTGVPNSSNGAAMGKPMDRSPKSMVIRIGAGEVGPSVSQLVTDLRLVMEPGTASRLKERKNNKLRDYTTMAGPLGVTHLLLFSKSPSGNTNMRLAITPRGPTLYFRVENFSLCKDILKSQKHPKSDKLLYTNAPLLVMNNFTTSSASTATTNGGDNSPPVPKHLESLITSVFQSLFPALNPQSTPLSSIRRVLLLNREPPSNPENGSYTITIRHYAISARPTGLPKPIKRLNAAKKHTRSDGRGKGVPNLGRLEDVSEWLLDADERGSYTSGSESEAETDAEVEVLAPRQKKLSGHGKKHKAASAENRENGPGVERKAVKLAELGPRMKLRLVKVEEGLCEGKVLWHEFVSKTKEEEMETDKVWEQRRREKEERKRVQRENLERKRKAKDNEQEDDEFDDEEWDSDMLDAEEMREGQNEQESEEDEDMGNDDEG